MNNLPEKRSFLKIPDYMLKFKWGWIVIDGIILNYSGITSESLLHLLTILAMLVLAPLFFYWLREEGNIWSEIGWGLATVLGALFICGMAR